MMADQCSFEMEIQRRSGKLKDLEWTNKCTKSNWLFFLGTRAEIIDFERRVPPMEFLFMLVSKQKKSFQTKYR